MTRTGSNDEEWCPHRTPLSWTWHAEPQPTTWPQTHKPTFAIGLLRSGFCESFEYSLKVDPTDHDSQCTTGAGSQTLSGIGATSTAIALLPISTPG